MPDVSFEFFPPKNDRMAENLANCVKRLAPLQPEFVSVTYGAGGSTRSRTLSTIAQIKKDHNLATAGHLTCVEASKEDVNSVLRQYLKIGVHHIVALRGDPPAGIGEKYESRADGYYNAAELATAAKEIGDFEITVGCYPEKHPESPDFDLDIDLLKRKIDAGATKAITQFFYDNTFYYRYLEKVRAAGVTIPIIPGIMPITNYQGLVRMAGQCGTTIPKKVSELFENLENDQETRNMVATTIAAEQCADLVEQGVNHFHFYTLNKAEMTYGLCHILGVRPVDHIAA